MSRGGKFQNPEVGKNSNSVIKNDNYYKILSEEKFFPREEGTVPIDTGDITSPVSEIKRGGRVSFRGNYFYSGDMIDKDNIYFNNFSFLSERDRSRGPRPPPSRRTFRS
jgi:hypothetical protein